MQSILKKAGLAVALGATALTVAAPAEAQRWHHNRHHGGDDAAAAALVGGIIGLGIGAAIASSDNDRYRSEEHTSELQSLMRISYAVFCLKKKTKHTLTKRK